MFTYQKLKNRITLFSRLRKNPLSITLTIGSSKLNTAFQEFIPKNEKRTLFTWNNSPPKANRKRKGSL